MIDLKLLERRVKDNDLIVKEVILNILKCCKKISVEGCRSSDVILLKNNLSKLPSYEDYGSSLELRTKNVVNDAKKITKNIDQIWPNAVKDEIF